MPGVVRDVSPQSPNTPITPGVQLLARFKTEFIHFVDVLEQSFATTWLQREGLWGPYCTYKDTELVETAVNMRRNAGPPTIVITADPAKAQSLIECGFATLLFCDPVWNLVPMLNMQPWQEVVETVESKRASQ